MTDRQFKTQKRPVDRVTVRVERKNPDPLSYDHSTLYVQVFVDGDEMERVGTSSVFDPVSAHADFDRMMGVMNRTIKQYLIENGLLIEPSSEEE